MRMIPSLFSLIGRRSRSRSSNGDEELVQFLRHEKRMAESASHEAREKLASLSDELQRLRQSEADLTKTSRQSEALALAKGEFLATMSHEIRTPLNGILPILELVLGAELDDELRRQVSAALISAKEMRRIVDDVLDFSKFENGSIQLETTVIRPIEIVQSVCSLMRRSADAKQLQLTCRVGPGEANVVRGDGLRLRQVVSNLVSNAIKFTHKGEVVVEVSQVGEDRSHRVLRIAVSDTGIGLSPGAADHLFKPFSQADASMARKFGGTGLGLAICRSITEAMNGRIGVQSTPGKGATFWIEVPFLRPPGEAPSLGAEQSAILLSRDDALRDEWARHFGDLELRLTALGTAYETLGLLKATLAARGASSLPGLVVVDLATAARAAASLIRPILAEPGLASVRVLLLGDSYQSLNDGDEDNRISLAPRELIRAQAHRAIKQAMSAHGDESTAIRESGPEILIGAEKPLRFDGLRVLLVDDISINRYAGRLVLEKLGCQVVCAGGGREAIDLMASSQLDVVLMDCQMPDVDGFSATRVMRIREKEEGRQRLPILAVTANAMAGDRERCLEAGMDDHLSKPIDIVAVSKLLSRHAAHAVQGEVAEQPEVTGDQPGPVRFIA